MTAFELLELSQPIISRLVDCNINPKYIIYVPLFREYIELRDQGHKVIYIASQLCEKHNITEYKFYSILKQFNAEV